MPIVEYDGVEHDFPDDFTTEDIAKALSSTSKPRSFVRDILKTASAAPMAGVPGMTAGKAVHIRRGEKNDLGRRRERRYVGHML